MKKATCAKCKAPVLRVGQSGWLDLEPLTVEQLVGLVERTVAVNGGVLTAEQRRTRIPRHFVRLGGGIGIRQAQVFDAKGLRPVYRKHSCEAS